MLNFSPYSISFHNNELMHYPSPKVALMGEKLKLPSVSFLAKLKMPWAHHEHFFSQT